MIFVNVIKEEGNTTTMETLDLMRGDAIHISEHYGWTGYKLTQEDFVSLLNRKKAENKAKFEAQQAVKEKEIKEKLQKNQRMGSRTGTPEQ